MKNKSLYIVTALWIGSLATAVVVHKKKVEEVRMEEMHRQIGLLKNQREKEAQAYQHGFDSGIACSIKSMRELGQSEKFIREALLGIGLFEEEVEHYLNVTD